MPLAKILFVCRLYLFDLLVLENDGTESTCIIQVYQINVICLHFNHSFSITTRMPPVSFSLEGTCRD